MTAGDHTDVRPAELLAHATQIETIAGRVATAQQAGDAVRIGAGAYGMLCTIVPVLLGELQGLVVDGIGTAAQSLDDSGARLRTAAGRYEATDERIAAAHDRVRNAL
jgi:hypothetical protein